MHIGNRIQGGAWTDLSEPTPVRTRQWIYTAQNVIVDPSPALPTPHCRLHEARMLLEISNDEAQELKWALDIRLVEMRGEAVRASDHAYRDDLRNSLSRLERVAQRLEEEMAKAGTANKGDTNEMT